MESCMLFRPKPQKLFQKNIAETTCYDVIIVPGAPVNSAYSKKLLQMRISWAVHLYKKGITDKIMMSGSAVSTPYKESVVMKQYAMSMGVPCENIYTEERSQHTTENLWYSYHEAKALGFSKIAVATDPWQSRFIYGYGKRKLPDLDFLPIVTDTLSCLNDTLPHIDFECYRIEDFTPLNKKQNRFQLLRGTLGRYIDYKSNRHYTLE